MKQKRNMYLIHCLIGISIMLLFRWLPFDMPKITDLGKQILGIFVGTLYLWTTVDLVWSSVICIFMIGATAYAPMPAVLSSAFGNPTVVQLFFLMILMSSLQTRRISLYIGRFFLTRKFIIGRPWAFTAVLFVGSMLIAAFVGCYAPIFLFWPILYDVFEEVGMERHEAYPTIMIILIVVACTLGFPVPPYMNNGLAMISNYATVSQNLLGTSVIINNAEWLAVALIYGFCSCGAVILFIKYVLRPDVSKLKNLTLEQLNKNPLPPMSKQQKAVSAICAGFLLSMLLPSIFPTFPGMAWIRANGIGMSLLFFVIIFAVKIDGEPIVVLEDNIKVFAWGTYFLVTTAILLGGVLTNESTGVTAFLNTILSPVFTNMSPFVFGVALLVIACFLTNICNSLVVGMILQPVIAAYCLQAGINSAPLVSIMGIFVLSCAIATPAASPFAALMFSNKQWLKTKHIYHYSVMFAGLELIVALLIGLPLANALIH